mmetsp:Transcript_110306/g.296034  ORF Transcript_110306/g.296034 Transcript_110306/m.296034 type:complete len:363 (-) Transcript_110306:532-1620(-)
MPKSTLVRRLVDDHGVFDIVSSVCDNGDNCVGATRMGIGLAISVHLRRYNRKLRRLEVEHLIVDPSLVVVIRRPHGLFEHLALVHVAWTLVVIGERREAGKGGKHTGGMQLLVGVLHGQLLRHGLLIAGRPRLLWGTQRELCLIALLREHGDAQEQLLQGADPLDGPAVLERAHGPRQAAGAEEEEEPREQVAPVARDAHDLDVLGDAAGSRDLQGAKPLLGEAQLRGLDLAQGAAVEHDPAELALRVHGGPPIAGRLGSLHAEASQHGAHGPRGFQRGRADDCLAHVRDVVQQTARRAIGGVHWAQEAPRLWQQLADCGRFHLCEVLSTVDGGEMRTVPGVVQLVGHHGVPRLLHEVQTIP